MTIVGLLVVLVFLGLLLREALKPRYVPVKDAPAARLPVRQRIEAALTRFMLRAMALVVGLILLAGFVGSCAGYPAHYRTGGGGHYVGGEGSSHKGGTYTK